jgi:hypothetical protein
VEEMISRLPATESPVWNRITAGVYSAGRIRGARRADGAGGVICLIVSIDLILHGIGDYQRAQEGEVTESAFSDIAARYWHCFIFSAISDC